MTFVPALEELDAVEARAITDQIKTGVEAVWHLITRAYTERAWSALGYSSWDDYCTREFGTARLRLPREERAEVVASLRESGLSLRAIAAATGVNRETVRQELAGGNLLPPESDEVSQSGTPALECDGKCAIDECVCPVDDEPMVDELSGVHVADIPEQQLPPLPENYMDIPAAQAPPKITGLDGKTYPQKPAEPPAPPRRRPITEAFDSATYELKRAVERVARLCADDRLQKNKNQIAGSNLSDLVRVRDALTGVINQIEG